MNKLKKMLSTFNGGNMDEDLLQKEFCKLADKLLYGGHFVVQDKRHIYLDEIEFYYHEEGEDGLKDPVMYHTNDHEGHEVPYFELGRFNMHTSGVDVTFENEEKHYRASFLIRAYSVVSEELNKKHETRSTYIYDDMFYMGIPMDKPIEIEWIEDVRVSHPEPKASWRINVAEYKREDDGKWTKIPSDDKDNSFSYYGTRYLKCHRQWRFSNLHYS